MVGRWEGGSEGWVVCGKSGLLRCVRDIVEQVYCGLGEVRALGAKEGSCWVLLPQTSLYLTKGNKETWWPYVTCIATPVSLPLNLLTLKRQREVLNKWNLVTVCNLYVAHQVFEWCTFNLALIKVVIILLLFFPSSFFHWYSPLSPTLVLSLPLPRCISFFSLSSISPSFFSRYFNQTANAIKVSHRN